MNLLVISHAYQSDHYLPTLEAMANLPGVRMALLCPARYMNEVCGWQSPLIQQFQIPIKLGSRQGTFLYDSGRLHAVIREFRPDLILHEQEVYALGAGQTVFAAKRYGIPLVFFVWENLHRTLSPPRRWLRRFVLKNASGVIAGSEQARKVHEDWGHVGASTVIPQMGIEVESAPRFGRRGGGVFKICYVGRLESLKGIDCLLGACEKLSEQRIEFSCAVAGTGGGLNALIDLSEKLKIKKAVTFPGFLSGEPLSRLYAESDVLVLPSRRTRNWEEQFGRVLTEAMAHGCVTVGSRTGSIPEVIGSDDFLFNEDDVEGLSRILTRLAVSPDFLEQSQRKFWCRAKEFFTCSHLAQARVSFLEKLIEKRP